VCARLHIRISIFVRPNPPAGGAGPAAVLYSSSLVARSSARVSRVHLWAQPSYAEAPSSDSCSPPRLGQITSGKARATNHDAIGNRAAAPRPKRAPFGPLTFTARDSCHVFRNTQPPKRQDSSRRSTIWLEIVLVRVREVLRRAIEVPTPRPPGVGGPGVAAIDSGQVLGEPDPLARLVRHDLRLMLVRLFLRPSTASRPGPPPRPRSSQVPPSRPARTIWSLALRRPPFSSPGTSRWPSCACSRYGRSRPSCAA
jgi:hypothetical protein